MPELQDPRVRSSLKPAEVAVGLLLGITLLQASWFGWIAYPFGETLGFVTGAWCVYLVVREHIWNFPITILSSSVYLVVFFENRLFGDAALQIVYVILGFHGWWTWLHGGAGRAALRIGFASPRARAAILLGVPAATVVLIPVLRAAKGAAPPLDSLTTVLSLVAQYLLNRKRIENWILWIVADSIYVYLYIIRGLQLTAILYAVFLGLAVAGFLSWRRIMAEQHGAGMKPETAAP